MVRRARRSVPVPAQQARPMVLCASCSARFDAAGAVTADRVPCPLCGEFVVLGGLVAERRRSRPRMPPTPPRRGARKTWWKREWTVLPFVLSLAAFALALSPYGERVIDWAFGVARSGLHPGK